MIRKVVYQMGADIPWLSPAGEDQTMKKSMSSVCLLVITIIFMIIHLRCKPYDSREFFILHKIESSMLWALLVTCLSQTWLFMSNHAWIFTDVSENQAANVRLRNNVCSFIVICFHLRFFGLIIYALVGQQLRRLECLKMCFGVGLDLRVEDEGLVASDLCDAGRGLLADTFRDLAMKQLAKGYFSYDEFRDLVKRVCIETFYQTERDEYDASNPVQSVLREVRDRLLKLPRKLICCGCVKRWLAKDLHHEDVEPWIKDPNYEFEKADFKHAVGKNFYVEDLQFEVIRLNWKLESHESKGGFMSKLRATRKSFRASRVVTAADLPDYEPSGGEMIPIKETANTASLRALASDSTRAQTPESSGLPAEVPLWVARPSTPCTTVEETIAKAADERERLHLALQAKDLELLRLRRRLELEEGDSDPEEWS